MNRAEKAALAARCDELAADVAALQEDLATAECRCVAAEASADAIAQVSQKGFGLKRRFYLLNPKLSNTQSLLEHKTLDYSKNLL